jgi:phosphoribosylanthranilate isomerase
MVKVKICGIRRFEDIEYVNVLKPDYVGFIFAKSKRRISIDFAKQLINSLNKDIKTVGVFVDENIQRVKQAAEFLNLDVVQLHGAESKEYIQSLKDEKAKNIAVWKALGIKHDEDIKRIKLYSNEDALVLDNTSGGTGQCFDWNIIKDLNINTPIMLAGGLDLSNLKEAIEKTSPYGVDVSSGVETDNYKDFDKIKKFILKVRELT